MLTFKQFKHNKKLISNYQNDPHRFKIASKKIKNNKNIVLAVMKKNGYLLEYTSDELKNDREVVITAISNSNGQALQYASEQLKNDREVIFTALKYNSDLLKHASDELKNDREIIIAALQKNASEYGSECVLKYVSDDFKNDFEIVKIAIKNSDYALQYASDKIKNDREFVMTAVKKNGHALESASNELKNDHEIVMTAIKNSGEALQYASDELKNDYEIVMAAVKSNGYALEYASDELKNNRSIVMTAVKRSNYVLKFASTEIQNDPAFISNENKIEILTNTIIQLLDDKLCEYRDIEGEDYDEQEQYIDPNEYYGTQYEYTEMLKRVPCFLFRNKEFVINIIKNELVFLWREVPVNKHQTILEYLSEYQYDDEDIMILLIEQWYGAFLYCSDRLKNDKEFISKAKNVNEQISIYMI